MADLNILEAKENFLETIPAKPKKKPSRRSCPAVSNQNKVATRSSLRLSNQKNNVSLVDFGSQMIEDLETVTSLIKPSPGKILPL